MPVISNLRFIRVTFKGCTDSLEDIFGTEDLSYGGIIQKLWRYIHRHKLKHRVLSRRAGVPRPPYRSPVPSDPIDDVRTYIRRKRT